jgi:hypothetical protein
MATTALQLLTHLLEVLIKSFPCTIDELLNLTLQLFLLKQAMRNQIFFSCCFQNDGSECAPINMVPVP